MIAIDNKIEQAMVSQGAEAASPGQHLCPLACSWGTIKKLGKEGQEWTNCPPAALQLLRGCQCVWLWLEGGGEHHFRPIF